MESSDNKGQPKKKNQGFTIISSNKKHSGSMASSVMDLGDLSSVIVDVTANEAYIDQGAIHAKSEVEKRIRFSKDKEEVPNGKPYWIVWVAADRNENGPYYAGVTGCYMEVDREARRGYKLLAEHVNRMDNALKRRILVDMMDQDSKEILRNFLQEYNQGMWDNSSDELRQGLADS